MVPILRRTQMIALMVVPSLFDGQTVRTVTCCLMYAQAALKHNEAKRSDGDTVYPVQANKRLGQVS